MPVDYSSEQNGLMGGLPRVVSFAPFPGSPCGAGCKWSYADRKNDKQRMERVFSHTVAGGVHQVVLEYADLSLGNAVEAVNRMARIHHKMVSLEQRDYLKQIDPNHMEWDDCYSGDADPEPVKSQPDPVTVRKPRSTREK